MSFQAIAWAVRQKLPCTQKIVLVMLADRHNGDTGRCDPSHDRLAGDCGLTRRSVMDQLAKLDSAGFIRTHHRVIGKLKASNQYTLMLAFGATADVKEFHIDVKQVPVVVNVVPSSSEPVAHKPVIEPVIEPKEKKAQAPSSFVLPDWINQTHWDAWHSSAKRKKTTDAQKLVAVETMAEWRAEGIDFAAALKNAAVGGWQGLFKPDDKKAALAVRSSSESFAERDARNARERWMEMTGREWPTNDLPSAAAPFVIDAEANEPRRIS